MPCQSEMTFTKQCMSEPNKRKRNRRGRGLMLLDRWNMPTANAYNQYKA